MSDFINCPKCGTRNFKGDKICRGCEEELVYDLKDELKSSKTLWTRILVFGLIAFVIFVLIKFNLLHNSTSKNQAILINDSRGDLGEHTSKVNYVVENVDNKPNYCLINIRLPNKISDETLRSLSFKIKQEQKCNSDKIRLFYSLPETPTKNGAWVRVDFDPTFSLHYLGLSLEEENYAKAHKSKFRIIGAWVDNNSGQPGIAQRIRYNSDGMLIMEYYEISLPDKEAKIATELRKLLKEVRLFLLILIQIIPENTLFYCQMGI